MHYAYQHSACRPAIAALTIGVLSGGMGSVVGAGGAIFMVPLVGRVFGLKQIQANATALVPNLATCLSGVLNYGVAGAEEDRIDWTTAALVAVTAVASTRVGARAAHRLSERVQKVAFGLAMICLGPLVLARPQQQQQQLGARQAASNALTPLKTARLLGLGVGVGLCSGMLGIGAGTMTVCGLALFGPPELTHKALLGTAFAAQALPHAMAAFTHYQLGNLRVALLPALVLGSAMGSAAGSRLASGLPDAELRVLFSFYTTALGISYLRAASTLFPHRAPIAAVLPRLGGGAPP